MCLGALGKIWVHVTSTPRTTFYAFFFSFSELRNGVKITPFGNSFQRFLQLGGTPAAKPSLSGAAAAPFSLPEPPHFNCGRWIDVPLAADQHMPRLVRDELQLLLGATLDLFSLGRWAVYVGDGMISFSMRHDEMTLVLVLSLARTRLCHPAIR
jgi:hypothetical protein